MGNRDWGIGKRCAANGMEALGESERGGRSYDSRFSIPDSRPQSVPTEHNLTRLTRFHQIETLLEFVDRQLVGEHLAERETAEHQLGHLVPGLVHLAAVHAVQGQALEDDLVP